MDAGRHDVACPMLEESYRLDPRPGALFTLATCEAKRGRLATAVAHYKDYLNRSKGHTGHEKRRDIAEKKLETLAPDVPELTLVLPKAPEGTLVKRDKTVLSAASLGIPLPVDPGEHVIVVQAPGGPPKEHRITIAGGEKKQLALEVAPPAAAAEEPPRRAPRAAPPAPPNVVAEPASEPTSARRVGAYVAGGVGLAGVVVGAVAGALTLGQKGSIEGNCDGAACNVVGKEAADEAQTLGLVSTLGFGVGVLGLGLATVLIVTQPDEGERTGRRPEPPRWVRGGVLAGGPTGAMVGVQGGF